MEKRNKNTLHQSGRAVSGAELPNDKGACPLVRTNKVFLFVVVLMLSIPCLTAQNTGYMGKRVSVNMGTEFSPAWKRPVCNINFDKEKYNFLAFNCILSPSIEIIATKKSTAGVAYHYLKTKYNTPRQYLEDSWFHDDTVSYDNIMENLTAHGFGIFYKLYPIKAPIGPYFKFQFDGFFYQCVDSYYDRTTMMSDKLFAMKIEFGNDFLFFDRLRFSTGFSLGVPFGGFKGMHWDNTWLDYSQRHPLHEYARSRILGAYWLGFTVNIGFLAF